MGSWFDNMKHIKRSGGQRNLWGRGSIIWNI